MAPYLWVFYDLNSFMNAQKMTSTLKNRLIHKDKKCWCEWENINILKFDFTEHMQYREKCFRNGSKLDKWRTYLVKSTGRNHYSNRYERKQFPSSLKRLKLSCKCSNWSSRKVTAVFRHWNIYQNLMIIHRIITFWTQKDLLTEKVAWIWTKAGFPLQMVLLITMISY